MAAPNDTRTQTSLNPLKPSSYPGWWSAPPAERTLCLPNKDEAPVGRSLTGTGTGFVHRANRSSKKAGARGTIQDLSPARGHLPEWQGPGWIEGVTRRGNGRTLRVDSRS